MGLINQVVPDAELRGCDAQDGAGDRRPRRLRAGVDQGRVQRAPRRRSGLSRMAHDLLLRGYLETEEHDELAESFAERRKPDSVDVRPLSEHAREDHAMSHLLTLHDPATAREHYLSGVWQTDTLYSLARRHATERGSAYALRDSARRLTWSALVAWVDAVAADLHDAGLRRGDRVSIWLPNRLENVVVLLACSRNGYVCNPSLHQNYTVAEIVTLLSRIECRALFAQPG